MAAVVVMGVSGSGKSTVAAALAVRLGVPFEEGDDLHPAANVAKMRAGHPLDDADRAPWLAAIHRWLRRHAGGGVVSCSALKHAYRDRLRAGIAPPPRFVLLAPPRAVLERRLARRRGHFMPAGLLDSQLATLEEPDAAEGALVLRGDRPPDDEVAAILAWLATAAGGVVR